MTSRCRTLVVMAALGLVLGVLRRQPALTLVSLSMLTWICFTAIYFYVRVAYFLRFVRCERIVSHGESAASNNGSAQNLNLDTIQNRCSTLWVDRTYTMRVCLTAARGWIPGIAVFRDLIPETVSVPIRLNPLGLVEKRILNSTRKCELTYQCVPLAAGHARFFGLHCQFQDPQGFFLLERVLHERQEYRVLPSHARVSDPTSRIKRVNALPQHGIHQLKRAGFGGDLLELREYQTGDPPKSIAWKISARRDRLMTRQYESEVPIRITLLMDSPTSVYAGLPGKRLIDQSNFLAASIAKASVAVGDAVGLVICNEQNVVRLRPAHGDRAFYQILSRITDNSQPADIPEGPYRDELISLAGDVCAERFPELLNAKINPAPISMFVFRPKKRRQQRRRLQLANVLADIFSLTPIETTRLLYDDQQMACYARRFLNECDRAWVPPVYEPASVNPAVSKPQVRTKRLAEELSRSVAHASDNEVYVLMLNLLDGRAGDPHLEFEQLLPSIRTAIARHHRVVVIAGSAARKRPERKLESFTPTNSVDVLDRAEQVRVTRLSQQFGRQLRSVGATFAVSGSPNVIKTVMAEAELAGTGRSTQGAGRK